MNQAIHAFFLRFHRHLILALVCGFVASGGAVSAWQDVQMPDGPGKEETKKLCSGCHELEKSFSMRQDREGWQHTLDKMVSFGMKGSEAEIQSVLEYLLKHYPAEDVPRIRINAAKAIELESGLSLKRSQAAAIVEYREKNGAFKSIEDLKKVPGIDPAKIEAKKDRIVF